MATAVPCNDLDSSEAFYRRLDFTPPDKPDDAPNDDRMLSDGKDACLHLTRAIEGGLVPGGNLFGLRPHVEDVDALAAAVAGETIEPGRPQQNPWGTYEFSLSDPDETLVRVGPPMR